MRDLLTFQGCIGAGADLYHLLNAALLISLNKTSKYWRIPSRAYGSIYSLTLLSYVRQYFILLVIIARRVLFIVFGSCMRL